MSAAKHTPGPWGTAPNWPHGMTAVCWHTGTGWQLVATAQTEADAERIVQCVNAYDELVTAARPLVAMTFKEAADAEARGKPLLYCQCDVLNPCWDGEWSKEHGPGKHWGGGDACPECNLRAAIAKATGSAA